MEEVKKADDNDDDELFIVKSKKRNEQEKEERWVLCRRKEWGSPEDKWLEYCLKMYMNLCIY